MRRGTASLGILAGKEGPRAEIPFGVLDGCCGAVVQNEQKDYILHFLCDRKGWSTQQPSLDSGAPLTSLTTGHNRTPVCQLHLPPRPLCLPTMDSPDDFPSNVAACSGLPDISFQIAHDAGFEQYLYSTPFHLSSLATTPTTPSLETSPRSETHNGVEKRIRKRPPKLEHCSKAQVTVRTVLLVL